MDAGDYRAEELFGVGGKPSCPKCVKPTGHAIPQALRDDFSVIEDKAMHWEGTRVFTQMRTATQAYFEEERLKPLNAPAEPKDLFFVEKVLAKLSRFNECAQDGQGADIGWHWFDILVRLSLLNRVRKSPALWELTAQGEIALAYARLAYWKPIINETIELSEEDKKAFLAAGFGIAVPIKYVSMAEMKARYPACDHKYVFFGESKRRQCKLCDELEPHACSLCGDTGKYQDGDSGTDEDGRAPNIVDCDCGAGLQ